ncbi:response regulator [Massilia horti]|uniref:Response regulator transcription factor n=1 Tax=Massilia horti TaxID=2562153 RepID=A0A4Y9T3P2_9BURK|nr:response regulator transcription factor [Massilia horti]TFW32300.1 response regulator transcription factor [Massilia horti]
MTAKHRILIVENHALLRAGLRALLASHAHFEVVGEAANGHEALQAARLLEPDLVLMDISMPGMNGIEALIDIKRRRPAPHVVVVTMHKEAEYINASLQAGAEGYLLKDSGSEELELAIRTVLQGKIYLSQEVSGQIIRGYLDGGNRQRQASVLRQLTHRERQVLKLIAEGHRNKDIAEYFSLSVKTIEKHRANLMQKLNLHNSSMLTSYAIAHGLLDE